MHKRFARLLSAAALLLAAVSAPAQDWPTKPVRLLVATPAGAAPDIVARVIGEKLSTLWGQPVVVENRGGAGGIPAMAALTRSPPDGYTLGVIQNSVIALTPHLFKDPQFNVDTDVTTVSNVVTSPLLIAVPPSLGVNTLAEFIALAKSRPGQIKFGLPILNSVPHLAGEQLAGLAGFKLLSVPFNGSAASITATIAGDASQVTIDAPAPLMPQVKAGKLKALAISTPRRAPGFEDVPTIAETLPGYEAAGWFAVFGPAHMPEAVLTKINRDINAVIQMPDVVAKFAPLALFPAPGTQPAAAAFVKADRERWAKVVKDLGIKPE